MRRMRREIGRPGKIDERIKTNTKMNNNKQGEREGSRKQEREVLRSSCQVVW